MKAIVLNEAGGVEQLQVKELPVPQPKPHEVLVKVRALSINPVDIKTRKGGAFFASMKESGPVILGWDISGEVTEVGSEVTTFKKGDEVFGMVYFPGHGKAYAEYVVADAGHLALKPGNISHEEAAAATLALLTAWQVLVHEAGLQQGQHVLVHAAAGGVGHYAVQIARHLGARVTGTASGGNADFLRGLGVGDVVDYGSTDIRDVVKDVDVVLDPIGGDTTARSIEVLKEGGVLVSIVGGVKDHLETFITEKGVMAKNYLVHSSGEDMKALARLLEQGVIRSYVSHHYSLDEIAEAHGQIESGHTRGKLVVVV